MAEDTKSNAKHRSPPYPAMTLPEAIILLRQFYDIQRRNPVHFDVAVKTLGYQPKSSGGLRAIASLIAYGLMEDEGSKENRKVKLTDLGFKLLMFKEDDPERLALVREAARKPTIYADMLGHWTDGLVSDDAIEKFLIFDRKYNPLAVKSLIADFRKTYEYAKFGISDTLSEPQVDEDETQDVVTQSKPFVRSVVSNPVPHTGAAVPAVAEVPGMISLPIALGQGRQVIVQYPPDLTPDDLAFFKTAIDFYSTKIVAPPTPPGFRTGSAVWRTNETDRPIVVTGYIGAHDGRHYVSILGSETGIPLDEVMFN